ncbi:DUF4376 domain-containing protein, partial [Bombella pollinis]
QPTPVTGWFDMGFYNSLDGFPPASELLPLTPEQWKNRLPCGQAVKDGKIVPYVTPKTLDGQRAVLSGLTNQKKALGVYFQPSATSSAVLFPSDDTSYANALQQAQVAQLGAWTDGTAWTLADGSSVPMSSDDVTGLFKKLAKYRGACQTHAAALSKQLENDLNTDLTAGWPGNR